MKMNKKTKIKIYIIAGISVFIILTLGISSLPSNRTKRCLDKASRCFQNQQYSAALDYYRSATIIDPYNTDAYLGQIQVCLCLGDEAMLEEYYENALTGLEGISEARLQKEMTNIVWIYSFSLELYPDEPAKAIRALNRGIELTHNNEYLLQLLGDNVVTMDELLTQNANFYSYVQNIYQAQLATNTSTITLALSEEQLLYFTLMANLDYISDTDLNTLFESGRIQKDSTIIYDNYLSALLTLSIYNLNYINSVGSNYNKSLLIEYTQAFANSNDIQSCMDSQQIYYQSYDNAYQEYLSGNYSVSYQSATPNMNVSNIVMKQAYGSAPIAKKMLFFLLSGTGNDDFSDASALLPYVDELLMSERDIILNNLDVRTNK